MYTPLVNVAAAAPLMSCANRRSTPPMKALPSVNAKLYPYSAHNTATRENTARVCISTDSTFLLRTNPP